MKKLIATTLLCTAAGLAAYAQGTVNFANVGAGFNAPVVLNDGTTKAGAGYTAVLMAGPSASSLTQIATTPLLTGAQAGFFLGGVQSISTVAGGGTATILIDIYNSGAYSSFAAAQTANAPNAWAQSSMFTVTTGNPNASPPTTPGTFAPLGTTPIALNPGGVPEPSTFALAGLGAAALLFFRRRK